MLGLLRKVWRLLVLVGLFLSLLGLVLTAPLYRQLTTQFGIAGQQQPLVNGGSFMEDLDREFFNALVDIESSGNPKAFDEASGARGLTQITPIAWDDLAAHHPEKYSKLNYEKDMFKPEIAMEAGKDYLNILKKYLIHYQMPVTMENLVASYNWGIGNLRKKGLENAPDETKNYIEKMRLALQPQSNQLDNRALNQ